MSHSELLSEALRLPAREREEFANQIWDSLDEELIGDVEQLDCDPALQAELERRLDELDSGTVTAVDAFAALAESRRRFLEKHG